MKRIVVIDSRNNSENWKKVYENAEIFEELPDYESEIYIVCQNFLGDEFPFVMKGLKKHSRHVIVVTSDNSLENQSVVCELGADDIIFYPVSRELLSRKIHTLTKYNFLNRDDDINFRSFADFEENNFGNGAFFVRNDNFENIYKFVLRLLERLDKNSQALIFTLDNNGNSDSDNQDVLDVLSNAVQICLRRGDIFSVNGSNQVIIILMGADDDGGHLVANRILSNFYSKCDDASYVVTYDMRKIVPQNI